MSEETQAASSTAVAEAPIEIPRSGTTEYAEWRMTGSLPEKKQESSQNAESTPADAPKEEISEDAADSAANKQQEKPTKRRPDVEARIKQLTDRTRELEAQLEEARRPRETKAESSPAKPTQPQNYQEWRKAFKPSQWIEQYGKDHPEESYEDANAAMADYLGDVRDQFRSMETQRSSQQKELNDKVSDARQRYGDQIDEVLQPTVNKIVSDARINPAIKEMINDSDVIADLIFVLGTDGKALNDLRSLPTRKALKYIEELENGIIEELATGTGNDRNDKGQFTAKEESPAKRGPESAPPPPIEIGSRGTGTMDESQRALQAIERGDGKAFRQWKAAEDRKALARRRGA